MSTAQSSTYPKPDFLVIGAMKCATSTVATYLENHPDVDMVAGGEPRFFSRDDHYSKGFDWYGKFFDGFSGDKLIGEGSNEYLSGERYPDCAARIKADLPDVKLVMMVRHPIKRIISAWIQYRADSGDFVPPSLDEAVVARRDYLIDQSLYWKNLQNYRAHFPDHQIFVGFMEDIAEDPDTFWADLCGFLGITHAPVEREIHANSTKGKRVPNSTYSTLKSMKVLAPVKQLLPKSVKKYLRNEVLSQSAKEAAQFSPETLATLQAQFRADAAELLKFTNKPADFWDLG